MSQSYNSPTPPSNHPQPDYSQADAQGRVPVSLSGFSSRPIVTYVLLGITITVFILQMATEQLYGVDIPAYLGRKENLLIIDGQWWRLLTPMFLHGNVMHIGFNMYALFLLGPGLERFYGHGRFLLLYVLAGFAGNVMSFLLTDSPSLGASTAIFGLLAAQAVFLLQNRRYFDQQRTSQALRNIIIVAVINFVIGLSPGIDNWGHLGGFLGGALFAWLAGPRMGVVEQGFSWRMEDTRSSSNVFLGAAAVVLVFGGMLVVALSFA
jgi:rhomboid protease GluP